MLDDFRRRHFPQTRKHVLSLDVLDEHWRELQRLFEANGWETEEGLRYTLAAGLAHLRTPPGEPLEQDAAAEIRRLKRERVDVESGYAVMRYRAFQFMQAAQALQIQLGACRAELEGLRGFVRRARQAPPGT